MDSDVRERIESQIRTSAACVLTLSDQVEVIGQAAAMLLECLQHGGTVYSAGNGGSAAEAMHLTEELSGRYLRERRALAGVSLCADATALTCIANDYGYEAVFSRQLEAFAQAGDVFVVFTSSGNSSNLVRGVETARVLGVRTLLLLGRGGGQLRGRGDVEIIVNHEQAARVQESHQVLLHVLLEELDRFYADQDGSDA
jgi:D-sedoheptulose 7-phosphate isomerase